MIIIFAILSGTLVLATESTQLLATYYSEQEIAIRLNRETAKIERRFIIKTEHCLGKTPRQTKQMPCTRIIPNRHFDISIMWICDPEIALSFDIKDHLKI